ncbi:SMI1/KNR4 family protein [Croceivirga radicis]|uniref:SMI1/KNR4 family protein n=1 Tax=Croceivirga radicis TaxID=1929488 RepID=UPI000255AC18|nr:SMI1/KNR4 family protein [Croceivirga radicis]
MESIRKHFANFLKYRSEVLSVQGLEDEHGFKLPPVYKSFITQFEGVFGDVYMDSQEELQTLTYYEYYSEEGENLFFEDFLPVDNIFKYQSNSDSWVEHGVAPITEHSHGGTILLGIKENNLDKLYFEYERGLVLIEENIYSFLRNLKFTFEYSESKEKLYKKWGEDFWRVKE